MTRIDSSKLTPYENRLGVNLAYWSMKSAYTELSSIQEELRASKNYELSDKVRQVMVLLDRGYSYRLGSIKENSND